MNRDHRTDVDQSRQEQHEYNKQATMQDKDHAALIAELRAQIPWHGRSAQAFLCHSAADAISALEAERDALRSKVERMEAALKPFAAVEKQIPVQLADCAPVDGRPVTTAGDFRRARQAITAEKQEAEG